MTDNQNENLAAVPAADSVADETTAKPKKQKQPKKRQ